MKTYACNFYPILFHTKIKKTSKQWVGFAGRTSVKLKRHCCLCCHTKASPVVKSDMKRGVLLFTHKSYNCTLLAAVTFHHRDFMVHLIPFKPKYYNQTSLTLADYTHLIVMNLDRDVPAKYWLR